MHVDELLELAAAVDNAMMRAEDCFKKFGGRPGDYVLKKKVLKMLGWHGTGLKHSPERNCTAAHVESKKGKWISPRNILESALESHI